MLWTPSHNTSIFKIGRVGATRTRVPLPGRITSTSPAVLEDLESVSTLGGRSVVQQLEPDLRAHAKGVAQLDIEEREGLQQARVLERSRIDGVKSDPAREVQDRLLRAVVIGCHERGQRLVAQAAGVHVLREHRVEGLHNPSLWKLLFLF